MCEVTHLLEMVGTLLESGSLHDEALPSIGNEASLFVSEHS